MGRPLTLALAGVVSVPLLALTASLAMAEERRCTGTIGAASLDNVRVPANRSCRLDGTRLKGTLLVERSATVHANGVRITGNIQAEGARSVVVQRSSRVGGSIQVKQGGGAKVETTVVNGDIQFDANRSKVIADLNTVGGSIQGVGNRGGASITSNRIDRQPAVQGEPPRAHGRANRVGGNREDQCRRF